MHWLKKIMMNSKYNSIHQCSHPNLGLSQIRLGQLVRSVFLGGQTSLGTIAGLTRANQFDQWDRPVSLVTTNPSRIEES